MDCISSHFKYKYIKEWPSVFVAQRFTHIVVTIHSCVDKYVINKCTKTVTKYVERFQRIQRKTWKCKKKSMKKT